MPSENRFGGDWTEEKLKRLELYLPAYMKIMKRNPRAQFFKTIYVDAFAGSGYRVPKNVEKLSAVDELADPEVQGFLKGSPVIALDTEPAFDKYLFIERDPEFARQLQGLKSKYSDKAERIQIVNSEANTYLQDWCNQVDWSTHRAVVFLDPFGMQVEWKTLEALARTQAIDLWLLVPLGIGIMRLLKKNELPPKAWADALTKAMGTTAWRQEFYIQRTVRTLFGDEESEIRNADFEKISKFFVNRLDTIFAGVAPNSLPLYNSNNNPLYLLCFAASNPRGAATAINIAKYLLKN
jgi:three-Cys-motif partner protein